ncbi:MAG: recombinase family protein [Bdellovibrionales bacterium]|nr:recombinase family protein [Bdellovibrionales bacterium]
MKVATYSRVSTSHHNQNPDVQVHELRRYCEARGWTIAHEIVDHGFSGATDVRPGLKELLSLVRERKVDVVVVVKMDRLFRSLRHLVATLEEWQAINIQFVATKDNIDYTTPAGRLLAQILGSLAEFEKGLLIERTMLGLEHARRSGKILGRPKTRDDAKIQELRAQGRSYTAIQKELGVSRGSISRALQTVPKTPKNQPQKTQRFQW